MTTVRCASSVAEPTDRVEFGRLVDYDPALLYVHVFEGTRQAIANPSRADFLAAVETECGIRIVSADAIVIDRAGLPEVTAWDGRVSAKAFTWSDSSPDDLREVAACYLAAAEYLDAPPVPPVSDEDVETLAGLVDEAGLRVVADASSRLIARRLLATGRVSVTK